MARKDKREDIIKAAVGLFTSRRYHEVTLDQVARKARVGKGTIYLYFQDKDDLFFQSATHGFDALCTTLQTGIPAEAAFEDKIVSMCKHIHEFFESRRPFRHVLEEHEARAHSFKGRMREIWLDHQKRLDAIVGSVFEEGVTRGHIRNDLEPVVVARLLLGFMGARARMFEGDPERSPDLEKLVDIFLHGMAARPSIHANETGK